MQSSGVEHVAILCGTPTAETILASGQVRPHSTGRTYGCKRSDPNNARVDLATRGLSTYGLLRSARNDEFSRSRGAIFVRARVSRPTMLLRLPRLRYFLGFPVPDPGRHKGEAERRETRRHNPRLAGTGRALAERARLSASPPRLLPGRQLVPKALHQAMLRETLRSVRSYGPPTGARIVRVSTGVTRAGKPNETTVPVQ